MVILNSDIDLSNSPDKEQSSCQYKERLCLSIDFSLAGYKGGGANLIISNLYKTCMMDKR